MKKFINFALVCFILISVISISGCKKKKTENDLDKRKEALIGTWHGTAKYEGEEFNELEDFTITFSANSFQTSEVPEGTSDLPESGTWTIEAENLNIVVITQDIKLTISQLDGSRLKFSTSAPSFKPGGDARVIEYNLTKE